MSSVLRSSSAAVLCDVELAEGGGQGHCPSLHLPVSASTYVSAVSASPQTAPIHRDRTYLQMQMRLARASIHSTASLRRQDDATRRRKDGVAGGRRNLQACPSVRLSVCTGSAGMHGAWPGAAAEGWCCDYSSKGLATRLCGFVGLYRVRTLIGGG
jgi:hypothetical protein